MTQAIKESGIAVDEIALRRPTLDDAFLALTGHPVEDGEQSDAEQAPNIRDRAESPRRRESEMSSDAIAEDNGRMAAPDRSRNPVRRFVGDTALLTARSLRSIPRVPERCWT